MTSRQIQLRKALQPYMQRAKAMRHIYEEELGNIEWVLNQEFTNDGEYWHIGFQDEEPEFELRQNGKDSQWFYKKGDTV